jgi:hypothetical protein
MKIQELLLFILFTTAAHIIVWFQNNAQFLDSKFKLSTFWLLLIGVPVSWLWIKSTQNGVAFFDGKFWPQRLIGFSIGIILYTLFTYLYFGEKFDLKSIICLSLALTIVAIQVLWK